MSWLESHQSLRDHPKKDRLAELLFEGSVPDDVADLAAIGLLHRLWWWAIDYAPKGELAGFTDRQLAKGCGWTGEAGLLRQALIEAGFIDRETGELHDWREYTGRLIEKRETEAERKRNVRAASGGRPADAPQVGERTYLPTKPTNQTDLPGSDFPQGQDGRCPVSSLGLDELGIGEEWRAAVPASQMRALRELAALGERTCAECRHLAEPAACRAISTTCREAFVVRLRQAIAAKPKSMPAYLKAIDGALPERLIEQLTDAKRRTQRAGAESSGEPERLAVSTGRSS
jgi:hypothetical protein